MNIFRIFFVSTVLIPVLVVVATSDESGIRIRKPRNIVISEDGTRTARRYNPVNISDRNCPSLGCTGNLTTNEYNGKGSLASTLLPREEDGLSPALSTAKDRRFESSYSSNSSTAFHHDQQHPLKLEIKSIKRSTRSDLSDLEQYFAVENDYQVDTGSPGSILSYAIVVSWAFFWTWRIILTFIIYYTFSYFWGYVKKSWGIGDDYIEYYVKLGQDEKHPFHKYGGGWAPTFGVSLKSKVEDVHQGWKGGNGWNGWSGWDPHGHHGQQGPHHEPYYASSYHDHHHHHAHSPPPYHAGAHEHEHEYGWHFPKKGWKSESEEEEDNLRHKFDRQKGWKIAKKFTKKYGKKAHKYGLRPSKYSYMFDENGMIVLGGKAEGYAWRSGLDKEEVEKEEEKKKARR